MPRACPHCAATHPSDVERCPATGLPIAGDVGLLGTTVADRYYMVRLLGDGGMGAVYKAADQVLHRFVAIKLLHPSVVRNPHSVERFVREARAAAQIGHPNIIDVLDFGYEGKRPYLVMEYVRGRALDQVIAQEAPLSVRRACGIANHALAGLTAAHEQGILHRDLKPANLMLVAMLGDRNFVKLCDFGFARLLSAKGKDGRVLTPERTLVGTPAYAAPERLKPGNEPDPRVDVYSVGVVLFEMLTGERPFHAPTFAALARLIRDGEPKSLRKLRPGIPRDLEEIILRALAKDPSDRWPTARALADALAPFGGRQVMPLDEVEPASDVFTVDLLKIRARHVEAASREAGLLRELEEATVPPKPAEREDATLPDIPIDVNEGDQTEPTPNAFEQLRARLEGMKAPEPEARDQLVSGQVVLGVLQFATRRSGERALREVIDALAPHAQRVFHEGVTKESWVSFEVVALLIQQIDRQLGTDDMHLVVECGRAIAEGAFELIRQVRPPSPNPELVLQALPKILGQLFQGTDHFVSRAGRGHGRVELLEHATPSLVRCVSILGFVDRSLDRFGGSDVEVNLMSCRALGDPKCIMDISWLYRGVAT